MEGYDQEEVGPGNVEPMRVWDLYGNKKVFHSCDHIHRNTSQRTEMVPWDELVHPPEVDIRQWLLMFPFHKVAAQETCLRPICMTRYLS